jgi:hypothetical protein
MIRCVALVITDVSEELSASFIRVTGIGELVTALAWDLALSRAIYDPRYFPFFVPLLLLMNPAF